MCEFINELVFLCDPVDCNPAGSSGIFQARIVEWVTIFSSRGSSQPRDQTHISCISCIGRQILYYLCHLRSPFLTLFPMGPQTQIPKNSPASPRVILRSVFLVVDPVARAKVNYCPDQYLAMVLPWSVAEIR